MKDYYTAYGSLVSGEWPNTLAKNASGPSATDGTPYTAEFINDIWGGRIDLMEHAGLEPDGSTEANGSSQLMKALHYAIRGPGEFALSALNATELALRRLMVLTGQVIAVSSYEELCEAVYCGDDDNDDAPAFYKTSDSSGSTRDADGAYMVMPDCRGLVPRGIGSNSSIFAANGDAYSGGSLVGKLLTDMIQGHRHYRNPSMLSEWLNDPGTRYLGDGGVAGRSLNSGYYTGDPTADDSNGTPRTGAETRGASFGAQICITY